MKLTEYNPVKTVLTISMGFLLFGLISKLNWLLTISIIFGLAGLVSHSLSLLIDRIWKKLSFLLSLIVPNILLTLIFYLFIFPVSLLSKLFREKDFLFIKNLPHTTFIQNEKLFLKESFEKPW